MSFPNLDFLTFRWNDALDILIVAFILYQGFRLVRGTRSAQIILGLGLLVIVAILAYVAKFEGVLWLFSNLTTFGLLVLVVVFQPELRAALANLGQNRLFRIFVPLQAERVVSQVDTAVQKLADLRYGALMVFERRTGLRNFVETGKSLSANLSSELLIALFTPRTPLHDGAVIIAGEMILAAGCSLTMTSDARYRDLFGMRHKAAIGISEVSDAVVVIVSEETGQISIAYDGELESNISRSSFSTRFAEYLRR